MQHTNVQDNAPEAWVSNSTVSIWPCESQGNGCVRDVLGSLYAPRKTYCPPGGALTVLGRFGIMYNDLE